LKDGWAVDPEDPASRRWVSSLVRDGAYHLTSSVPVTVYQFNPLEYELEGDCADLEEDLSGPDGRCFSFTNDASLLLPTNVHTGNYRVLSLSTQHIRLRVKDPDTGEFVDDPDGEGQFELYQDTPGFAAIIGTSEGENTVTVRFTAHVQASADGDVRAFAPGDEGTFELGPGDVLQLMTANLPETCGPGGHQDETEQECNGLPCIVVHDYCPVGAEYDLTGTEIAATGTVAVVAGHHCAFVPSHRWACDHLEEMIFPRETWGKEFLVSATEPLRGEPNLFRIVSDGSENRVTFTPAVHEPVTLGQGEVLEFESGDDFLVSATSAILVGQFLVGQDYAGRGASGPGATGDPALSLAIPTEQFRSSYAFLAPDTYQMSFVNVTARMGQTVMLDGDRVMGFRPVGATGLETARVPISGGAHTMTSTDGFGIVVYGFGSYTSYMYPGGLDLETINLI
jgi:hypothetical protein